MGKSWTPNATDISIDQGWDGWVRRPNIAPDAAGEPTNGANAILTRKNSQMIGLWVNEITADFQMSGIMAQSKDRRTFFPHNFVAPVFQVSGQTTNSYEYNRLALFVRHSQLNLANDIDDPLRLIVPYPEKETSFNRPQRGSHTDIDLEGYATTINAGAERWMNAPNWTFAFTITRALQFPGIEDPDPGHSKQVLSAMNAFFNTTLNPQEKWFTPKKHKGAKSEDSPPDQKAPGNQPKLSGTGDTTKVISSFIALGVHDV